jgi:hypothetical protein
MWATAKRLSKGWGQARVACGQDARPVPGVSLAPGLRLSTGNRRGRIGLVPSPAFSTALPGFDYGYPRWFGHRAASTRSDAASWGRLLQRRRLRVGDEGEDRRWEDGRWGTEGGGRKVGDGRWGRFSGRKVGTVLEIFNSGRKVGTVLGTEGGDGSRNLQFGDRPPAQRNPGFTGRCHVSHR